MLADDPKQFPLALRSVYVRQSSTWMKDTFDPFLPNQRLTARFRNQEPSILVKPSIEQGKDGKNGICTYVVHYEFAFAVAPESGDASEDAEHIAGVQAVYAIDYSLRGKMPSDAELDAWGSPGAIIHSWAYWREFCQGSLSRMSLPAIVMPMLDVVAVMNGIRDAQANVDKAQTGPKKRKVAAK